jgi:Zn-dependent protease
LASLTPEAIAIGLSTYVVLLFSLSFHESAHAWAASRMGDDTARRLGRISLNPIVHIDPIGTVLMPLLQIFASGIPLLGWAKPTPVNPRLYSDLRRGELFVSGAGPVSNLILALGFTAALFVVARLGLDGALGETLLYLLSVGVTLNIVLALFNLVPLPPLDGSHVLQWLLPPRLGERYAALLRPYGTLILLALVMTGVLGSLLRPLVIFFRDFLFALVR